MTTDLEDVMGAVARGWCDTETQHLVMNQALAMAIVDQVFPLFVKQRHVIDDLTAERDRYREALEVLRGFGSPTARKALNPPKEAT